MQLDTEQILPEFIVNIKQFKDSSSNVWQISTL